jgi:hypothetical protein
MVPLCLVIWLAGMLQRPSRDVRPVPGGVCGAQARAFGGHAAEWLRPGLDTDGKSGGKVRDFGPEFSGYNLYRDPVVHYRD